MDAIDLYPTKTRLRLLRLVEAGVVQWNRDTQEAHDAIGGITLTARVTEAEKAGWLTVPRSTGGPVILSTLGADKLAEADRC